MMMIRANIQISHASTSMAKIMAKISYVLQADTTLQPAPFAITSLNISIISSLIKAT